MIFSFAEILFSLAASSQGQHLLKGGFHLFSRDSCGLFSKIAFIQENTVIEDVRK